ncbi:MAG: hypothetical protein WC409_01215 [Candidatus Omnitrophota bacterium]|jgi:hypothetical protein|nr:hypothetical protein [Candidatus Omnitrophota bacterium]
MNNKFPTWLIVSIGLVPLLSVAFLLIWMASTGTVKYEQSYKPAAPIQTQRQELDYGALLEKNNRKIKSIQTHESLLQDQKEKELNQTRQDTEDQLQLMTTQKEFSNI